MLLKFIQFIQYLFIRSKVKIEEPLYTLPIDQNTALRTLIRDNIDKISYKRYPLKGYWLQAVVQINKIKVNFENIKYKFLYSSWLQDKRFKDREYLKYDEDDCDFMNNTLNSLLFSQDKNNKLLKEYSYENLHYTRTYSSLEKVLLNSKNKYIQEYILDQIFKFHPSELYNLLDLIYSPRYWDYIKGYYERLIILLFDYTTFSDLVKFYKSVNSLFTQDRKIKDLKEKLFSILQRKNTLEIQKDQLEKNNNI